MSRLALTADPTALRKPPTIAAFVEATRRGPPWLATNTHLLVRAGSDAHGLADDESDVNIRGLCLPPREYYLGFHRRFDRFYSRHPNVEILELRTFMRAAAGGDLQALLPLFVHVDDVLLSGWAGVALRERRNLFLSQKIVAPLVSYAKTMINATRGMVTEARKVPGFNIRRIGKAAMHATRAVVTLREVLRGQSYIVRRPDAEYLRSIRDDIPNALMYAETAEGTLSAYPEWIRQTGLPELPDYGALDALCQRLISRSLSEG